MKLKSHGITTQILDNELIINDSERDQVHVLNETAAIIWKGLDRKHSLKSIEQEIRQRYSIDTNEDIIKQIHETLAGFRQKGLLLDED